MNGVGESAVSIALEQQNIEAVVVLRMAILASEDASAQPALKDSLFVAMKNLGPSPTQ